MVGFGMSPLSAMVTEVQRILQDTSLARVTDIKAAINRALDTVSAQMEWPQLVFADETGLRKLNADITTFIAEDPYVPMPHEAATIRSIIFQEVGCDPIKIVPAAELYSIAGSSIAQTGRPRYAAKVGVTAQFIALDDDDSVTLIDETSASNDNVNAVTVEYQRAGGVTQVGQTEVVTGAFSAGVQLSGTVKAGYSINKVHLPVGWVGNLAIYDSGDVLIVHIHNILAPGGTTLAGQTQTIATSLFRVWPTPDADYPATIVYQRKPSALTLDSDTPEIPVSSYLVEKVAGDLLLQENKMQMGMIHDGKAERMLAAMMRQSSLGPVVAVPMGGGFLGATGVHPTRGGW